MSSRRGRPDATCWNDQVGRARLRYADVNEPRFGLFKHQLMVKLFQRTSQRGEK